MCIFENVCLLFHLILTISSSDAYVQVSNSSKFKAHNCQFSVAQSVGYMPDIPYNNTE